MAKKAKRKAAPGDVATNRYARHKYELTDRWEAGIELQGSEVKSIRAGKIQLKDSYAQVRDGEVWLVHAHIAPYEPAAREGHEPERPRKLLLHRSQIERLIGAIQQKGFTVVPTRVYFKGSRAKVEIALARGKEIREKRRQVMERDQRRDFERALKERD